MFSLYIGFPLTRPQVESTVLRKSSSYDFLFNFIIYYTQMTVCKFTFSDLYFEKINNNLRTRLANGKESN